MNALTGELRTVPYRLLFGDLFPVSFSLFRFAYSYLLILNTGLSELRCALVLFQFSFSLFPSRPMHNVDSTLWSIWQLASICLLSVFIRRVRRRVSRCVHDVLLDAYCSSVNYPALCVWPCHAEHRRPIACSSTPAQWPSA